MALSARSTAFAVLDDLYRARYYRKQHNYGAPAMTRLKKIALATTLASAAALAGIAQIYAADAPIEIDADTFECITEMTPVRGFYVDNLLGDIAATLAVANSETGGTWPTGSVVQLVPTEVMVKQPAGTSPQTNDWEFFELDVSSGESEIVTRGFTDVVNRFGGNCLDCHVKAEPQWDMICETGHGCDPIPLSREMIVGIQQGDPRCNRPE
ncbi:MAG: hypothetical protein CMQ46_04360 [Gammaproteobacteria bacterium]|nr:hypothetical protein [Gammaproteobacteria bacterium]HBN15662.1 hypothetical protein [Pseudohongiella sp.]|tara:strand:- start:771 stop:1403 length:633 start_codon:yes stop_codon:yes gene_type:complete